MHIAENVPLALYSTMRLGGRSRFLTHVRSNDELVQALEWARKHKVPFMVIGGGANVIFTDDGYPGLIIVNDIAGIQFERRKKKTRLTIGAGEIWDNVVAKAAEAGLTGIEALSKIPGKAGAAPVQNIGAYGQELATTFVELEAYDTHEREFVTLKRKDCQFSYRKSRFNTTDKGRFIITTIVLELEPGNPRPPYYRDVQAYLERHNINEVTPRVIRQAVTDIRAKKLPDPSVIPNSGSFFYNPIISKERFTAIAKKYPEINEPPPGWTQPPRWFLDDGSVKISAGWLVEQAGFSGYEDIKTGVGLWPSQSLVVVNKHAKRTAELLGFTSRIIAAVHAKFGITLQQEPELVKV